LGEKTKGKGKGIRDVLKDEGERINKPVKDKTKLALCDLGFWL
jgi:hypothetical protein